MKSDCVNKDFAQSIYCPLFSKKNLFYSSASQLVDQRVSLCKHNVRPRHFWHWITILFCFLYVFNFSPNALINYLTCHLHVHTARLIMRFENWIKNTAGLYRNLPERNTWHFQWLCLTLGRNAYINKRLVSHCTVIFGGLLVFSFLSIKHI